MAGRRYFPEFVCGDTLEDGRERLETSVSILWWQQQTKTYKRNYPGKDCRSHDKDGPTNRNDIKDSPIKCQH